MIRSWTATVSSGWSTFHCCRRPGLIFWNQGALESTFLANIQQPRCDPSVHMFLLMDRMFHHVLLSGLKHRAQGSQGSTDAELPNCLKTLTRKPRSINCPQTRNAAKSPPAATNVTGWVPVGMEFRNCNTLGEEATL